MSAREAQRLVEQSRQSDPAADRELELNQFRVMSFAQWCALNGISPATGRRLLGSGRGPIVTRLSDRRIGITVGNNRRWQEFACAVTPWMRSPASRWAVLDEDGRACALLRRGAGCSSASAKCSANSRGG